MRPIEVLYLLAVAACATAFTARTGAGMFRRGAAAEGGGAPPAMGTAGRPRDVDPERMRRLIREGILSDREALFFKRRAPSSGGFFETSRRLRVLGTEAEVTVLWPESRKGAEEAALRGMEEAWRGLEKLLEGEMERLRTAGLGPVPIAEPVGGLLREARRLHRETRGAFDVASAPLQDLWRRAAGEGRVPSESEIGEARSRSGWDLLEVTVTGAEKKGVGVGVDLGVLVRGHAVDRAVGDLETAGAAGARIRLGEVLRAFGRFPGGAWEIQVPHPFRPGGACARLRIPEGALCLGGSRGRLLESGGRRLVPFPDPRTGGPPGGIFTAAVAGPAALDCAAWAEALGVLGPEGLELLPSGSGLEGFVAGGSPESPRAEATPGFRDLLVSGPDF